MRAGRCFRPRIASRAKKKTNDFNVRTVAFGETITPDIRKGYGQYRPYGKRIDEKDSDSEDRSSPC
jgi:hypothetical protein